MTLMKIWGAVLILLLIGRWFIRLFTKDAPSQKRNSVDDLVDKRWQYKHCSSKAYVYPCYIHMSVCFQNSSDWCNDQVVSNVDAIAWTSHVWGKFACSIETCFEPSHHGKTHQPWVDVVHWRFQILWNCVVLSESCECKYSTRNYRACHKVNPVAT